VLICTASLSGRGRIIVFIPLISGGSYCQRHVPLIFMNYPFINFGVIDIWCKYVSLMLRADRKYTACHWYRLLSLRLSIVVCIMLKTTSLIVNLLLHLLELLEWNPRKRYILELFHS
jgi:hypothetical protein